MQAFRRAGKNWGSLRGKIFARERGSPAATRASAERSPISEILAKIGSSVVV